MSSIDKTSLLEFTALYLQKSQGKIEDEALLELPSPCIIKIEPPSIFWRSVFMQPAKHLANVEQIIGITLHTSAHIFYGTQYAADMKAIFSDISLSLIQIWNDDDFYRLEQNLIAHLSMQKKLKLYPTIFIASTHDDSEIISLDNVSGEVVKESLITGETTVLHQDLSSFLTQLDIHEVAMQYVTEE